MHVQCAAVSGEWGWHSTPSALPLPHSMPAFPCADQQVVWEVPLSAVLPASPSSPQSATPVTPGTDATTPSVLLSPTFMLPCGVTIGGGGGSPGYTADGGTDAADAPELACTEWWVAIGAGLQFIQPVTAACVRQTVH